ncbi:hypothetical protein [Paraburkholderia sp. C35]|uniref:hypothetical protein n=1 Tax=Paraburkholderia sp. C35 TaxID=2126993 RepID=UPI000D6863B6|nr:hypothetical protein [Paraburkholderia sp. C35]
MTTTTVQISHEVACSVFGSIKLNNIESFDDEHDPEVYSTNIYLDVTIEGETYPIIYQRGTDGDVERAPWESCGMADVYIAIMKMSGEYIGEDEDDVKDMFEENPEDHNLAVQTRRLGRAIVSVASMVAAGAQREYDGKHDAALQSTPEFGVDARGEVCDVDSDKAVTRFNYANSTYSNMIQFNVSEKNDDGEWQDAGGFDCFHFHLSAHEVYQRYLGR